MDSEIAVLVVGGSGFLGHHLTEDLMERRYKNIHYHQGDITSKEDVRRVLELVRPTIVFHEASPNAFEQNHKVLESVNITGTRNFITCAQEIGTVQALVYVSSSSVIHDHYHALVNANERLPVFYYPQQPSFYSHTKAVAEKLVLAANRTSKYLLTAVLRPASMYGEGDRSSIPNLVQSARAGRAHVQIGPGTNKFDTTYVKNITHAQILAAEALLRAGKASPLPRDSRVEGEAFFVTDNGSLSFADIPGLFPRLLNILSNRRRSARFLFGLF